MKTRHDLRQAHGTPEQFEAACKVAHLDSSLGHDAVEKAVAEYRAEYNAAPELNPIG